MSRGWGSRLRQRYAAVVFLGILGGSGGHPSGSVHLVLTPVTQTARFLRPFREGGVSPPEQEKLLPPITLGHRALTEEADNVLSVALDGEDFRYDN